MRVWIEQEIHTYSQVSHSQHQAVPPMEARAIVMAWNLAALGPSLPALHEIYLELKVLILGVHIVSFIYSGEYAFRIIHWLRHAQMQGFPEPLHFIVAACWPPRRRSQ